MARSRLVKSAPLTGRGARFVARLLPTARRSPSTRLNALGGQQYELNAQDDEADAEKSVNAYNKLLDWGAQMMLAISAPPTCIAVERAGV